MTAFRPGRVLITRVLITGASSGIGQALAEACAGPGIVLFLSGRNAERLEQVARACRERGAEVHASVLDVCDQAGMADWVKSAGRLDLVIANAGISAGNEESRPETPEQMRAIFATNVQGVLNTALPALEVMEAQDPGADGWRGRIAVVASVVAFFATPHSPAYAASKAAADRWAVGIAHAARQRGILVSSICPGFVRSRMTERNRFPMPGLMDADRAAGIILRGLARGRTRIAFPWRMGVIGRVMGLLPPRVFAAIADRHLGKGRSH